MSESMEWISVVTMSAEKEGLIPEISLMTIQYNGVFVACCEMLRFREIGGSVPQIEERQKFIQLVRVIRERIYQETRKCTAHRKC